MSTTSIGAARVGTGPVHAARIGWKRGVLEIKELFRQPESVTFSLAFPVILLLVLGSLFSYKIEDNLQFNQYFIPGIMAVGLFGVAFQTLAIQIAMERDKGILKRLEGTPMPPSAYFLGKIIMVLTMVVLEFVLLLVVAALMGKVHLPTSADKWLTLAWVTVLGVAACTVAGIAFSVVPRTGRAAPAVITPIALVLQFFSGVYFEFTRSPRWLQEIGAIFPVKWIAQGFRSVFLPDSFAQHEPAGTWEHGKTALYLALWAVAGLAVAVRRFRWRAGRDA